MPKLTTDYNNQNIYVHAHKYNMHRVTNTITQNVTIMHLVGNAQHRITFADSLQHCANEPINCSVYLIYFY